MGSSSGTTTTTQEAPEYLQPYLKDIASQAQGLHQPGLTGQEQSAISAAQGYAPMIGQGVDTMGATARGDFLFGGQGFNQALDAASRRIQPQVQSMFGRAGRSGSGLAQTAMTQAMSDSFAGQYGQERGRQQQAAMVLPGMASQAAQGQMGIAQMPQNVLFGNLNRYAGIINPQAAMGGTTQEPYHQNNMAGIGGLLSGVGALAAFSDRRLKENITKVGSLDNGLNVYSYNYKSGGPTVIGVMADEVEKVKPEAVTEHDSGYKMVRYDMLGA